MKFSASQLVKSSAKSIFYLRAHKEAPHKSKFSRAKGNELADKKIRGFRELGCNYTWKDHIVFFSYDEVLTSKKYLDLIEYKSIQFSPAPDWYFHQALIQTALYHVLGTSYPRQDLETSKFFRGIEWKVVKYKSKWETRSFLVFGNTKYRVKIKKGCRQKLLNLFLTKAESTLDYKKAAAWDKKWHKKDKHLLRYITFERV